MDKDFFLDFFIVIDCIKTNISGSYFLGAKSGSIINPDHFIVQICAEYLSRCINLCFFEFSGIPFYKPDYELIDFRYAKYIHDIKP